MVYIPPIPKTTAELTTGHESGCDCAVCDDINFRCSLAKNRRIATFTEWYEENEMTASLESAFVAGANATSRDEQRFRGALQKIARGTLEPGHLYEQAVRMQDIAREALADRP